LKWKTRLHFVVGEPEVVVYAFPKNSKHPSNIYGKVALGSDARKAILIQRQWHGRHSGTGTATDVTGTAKPISTRYILKAMFDFIWPKTGKQVKIRVLIALGLLLISKVH
jgi:hypothetical protein